jgi:hypothetical protein
MDSPRLSYFLNSKSTPWGKLFIDRSRFGSQNGFDLIKTGLQVITNRVKREHRPAKSWLRGDRSQLEKIREDSCLPFSSSFPYRIAKLLEDPAGLIGREEVIKSHGAFRGRFFPLYDHHALPDGVVELAIHVDPAAFLL